MILSKKALRTINNKESRLLLAQALGLTEQSIIRLISKNSDALTKAAAMEVIRKQTGLKDVDLLVNEKATV
jgi:hypothetical protein